MSEKNLQKALIHLYANIDRFHSYSAALFDEFGLSPSEQQSLKELMTTQREGLLVFNQQLRHKQRRSIWHALPKSQALFGGELDVLLEAYVSGPAPEGARPPADALRAFADYVGARISGRPDVSKPLEFIRFEALYASISTRPHSTDLDTPLPLPLSGDVRLSLGLDGALIPCTYDVWAAIENPSLLELADKASQPRWFLLFRAGDDGDVRLLTVAPGLTHVLQGLLSGLSLGEVLRTLASDTERTAAAASLERLLMLGAPFFTPHAPADRGRHPVN